MSVVSRLVALKAGAEHRNAYSVADSGKAEEEEALRLAPLPFVGAYRNPLPLVVRHCIPNHGGVVVGEALEDVESLLDGGKDTLP